MTISPIQHQNLPGCTTLFLLGYIHHCISLGDRYQGFTYLLGDKSILYEKTGHCPNHYLCGGIVTGLYIVSLFVVCPVTEALPSCPIYNFNPVSTTFSE